MQPTFLPGALAVLIGALIAGLDRAPQLIAAQPTIAPSPARAVDNQCVTAAVDAWAETSGLQGPAWMCRNATVAFAVAQAQAEATCFHTCQPQNEGVITIYIMSYLWLPEFLLGIRNYLDLRRGYTVEPSFTPVTSDIAVYAAEYASIYTYTQTQAWDTSYYYYLGYDLQYPELVIPENQSQNMKEPRGLLHPRAYLVMFYRRDLFNALGLAPPETWEQLLQLATNTSLWAQAAVVNTLGSRAPSAQASSGIGAAGTRPAAPAFSGLCLPLKANCTGAFLLMNIWASLTQYLGLDQGLHFEPLTMQPLVDSPAMDEALRLYARLAAAASPDSLTTCGPLHPAFLAGSCAITVGWDHYFSYTASQPVSGSVGVAPLPGSTRVWDRQVSRGSPASPLGQCRRAAGLPRNADQAAAIHCPHATPLADGSWVNQAPLSQFFYTSMRGNTFRNQRQPVTDAMLSSVQPRDADALFSLTATPPPPSTLLATTPDVLVEADGRTLRRPGPGVVCMVGATDVSPAGQGPCIALPVDGNDPPHPNVATWLLNHPGVDEGDAVSYFKAVWAVKWHPNAASDINTYYSEYARAAFMHAAWRVLEEGLANMTGIQAELAQIYSATVEATRFTGLLDPQTLYWQQVDFTPSSPPPSPPPPSPPSPPSPPLVVIQVSGRLSSQTLTAAVTTPLLVVGALLVAWITSSYILRQRGQHRSLLGGILPPGVGPATTLMVTDIQDSTALWEALPDHVMDATIALHHATIRACLTAFTAYEVTTEGDSFILATHNPHDALLLATAIHQQLLQCSWPGELLNMPQCSPTWAVPSTFTALVAQSNAALRHSASGPTPLEGYIGSRSRSIDPRPSKQVPGRLRSYRHRRSSHSPASRSPHMTASALWAANNPSGPLMGPRSTTALDDPQFSTKAMSELGTAAQRNVEVLPWLQRPQLSGSSHGSGASATLSSITQPFRALAARLGAVQGPSQLNMAGCTLEATSGRPSPPLSHHGHVQLSLDPADLEPSRSAAVEMSTNRARRRVSICEDPPTVHAMPFSADLAAALDAVPAVGAMSVKAHLASCVALAKDPPGSPSARSSEQSGTFLLLCGPRLRVGVSSGLESDTQRTWNKAAGRMQYSGRAMEEARAASHACPGGLTFLTESSYKQMAYRQLPADMVLVNVGDYQLKVQGTDPKQARTLYVCCPAEHVYRFLDACPVRCLRPLSTTFLDAPFSQAAVVYLYVVGLGSLAAWNSQVTATAMGLCLSILNRQLHLYGGYCVEQAESLCLATFCHPHTAIRWALACIQLCLAADWPQELLEHELGEEMLVPTPLTRLSASAAAAALQDARRAKRGRKLIGGVPPKPAAALHPDTSQAAPPVAEVHPPSPDPKAGSSSRLVRVLLRGLRLKAGIDYGPVSASVHAALARMTYTGRVMNRSSRVAGLAKTGQVWCTESAWLAGLTFDSTTSGSSNSQPASTLGQLLLSTSNKYLGNFPATTSAARPAKDATLPLAAEFSLPSQTLQEGSPVMRPTRKRSALTLPPMSQLDLLNLSPGSHQGKQTSLLSARATPTLTPTPRPPLLLTPDSPDECKGGDEVLCTPSALRPAWSSLAPSTTGSGRAPPPGVREWDLLPSTGELAQGNQAAAGQAAAGKPELGSLPCSFNSLVGGLHQQRATQQVNGDHSSAEGSGSPAMEQPEPSPGPCLDVSGAVSRQGTCQPAGVASDATAAVAPPQPACPAQPVLGRDMQAFGSTMMDTRPSPSHSHSSDVTLATDPGSIFLVAAAGGLDQEGQQAQPHHQPGQSQPCARGVVSSSREQQQELPAGLKAAYSSLRAIGSLGTSVFQSLGHRGRGTSLPAVPADQSVVTSATIASTVRGAEQHPANQGCGEEDGLDTDSRRWQMEPLAVSTLGPHQLKGVQEMVHLVCCAFENDAVRLHN
ncbi:hypothetical protein V8C86DRAFT_2683483 [Haematococcus lacustris]